MRAGGGIGELGRDDPTEGVRSGLAGRNGLALKFMEDVTCSEVIWLGAERFSTAPLANRDEVRGTRTLSTGRVEALESSWREDSPWYGSVVFRSLGADNERGEQGEIWPRGG